MIRLTDEPTAVTLDLDQAELALNPTRTRVWAPIGVPFELETPGDNRKQPIFGAVNTKTGRTHFALKKHKRSVDLQEFLEHEIIPSYPEADFVFTGVDDLARRLRLGAPPVVGRVADGRLLLDMRTVLEEQDELLVAVVRDKMMG